MLMWLVRQMKEASGADEASVRRQVPDFVATFNALSLPRGYAYVDPDGLVHVILIRFVGDRQSGTLPIGVDNAADVIWHFNPTTGMWVVVKDRTGKFARASPIRCGGFPSVKVCDPAR